MTVPSAILNYLNHNNIDYQVIQHQHSQGSFQSSQLAHVDANKVAKAVLLKDRHEYVLAVLPASRSIDMHGVREEFGEQMQMAKESEIGQCFPDCELGAIPAIGELYGFSTIVDKKLQLEPEIYFEAGDHEDLIQVSETDFEKMLPEARYSYITKDWE